MPAVGRSVEGRVAVVTGAASGMGRATAELLAAEGAVVAALDQDERALEGVDMWSGVVDVTDRAAVGAVVAALRADLGPVDILVNNAGVSMLSPIDSDDYEQAWDRTLAVNLTAYTSLVRACLADLKRNGDGRIVNVASTEGLGATAFITPYTASKHGVIGLTRGLAVELAPTGVTVNCVCPGPINTAMTALFTDEQKTRFARRRVPARRYGEPEEVAQMIVSLVLPGASYTNGAVLTVDGGLTVQNT